MKKFLPIHSVVFVLIASVMTNALAWAFHGEVFLHELDHHQHAFLATEVTPLDFHRHSENVDEKNLNHPAHLCLSAAGHYQPFFFTFLPLISAPGGKEIQNKYLLSSIPESILDSLFRPPRSHPFN